MKISERIYRGLLRLYPRDFRDEYGREMSLLFRARVREGGPRLWLQVLGDLLLLAPHEHWSIVKQDVRYALRSWRRTPAIPAIALTALTFGMGANTAIFSVVHAVLLRPLPVREPGQLMLLHETSTARNIDTSAASVPNYLSWKERARSLELAAFSGQTLTWTGTERPERLEALAATASFLPVLGASLERGRWFVEDEERGERGRVVVLSHRLWRSRFGEDRDVLGRRLILNGTPYSIIGVASPELSVPSEPDLWVPKIIDPVNEQRDDRYISVLGRLEPGFTRDQAQAEMTAIARNMEREFPDANRGFGVQLVALSDSLVPADIRAALVLLLAAAGMVLLIACANVANVLLSRAAARRKEMSIRAALGAGAVRIRRQLLTESVLLSVTGGLLGALVAAAIGGVARRALVDVVPRVEGVGFDVTVLAFALGVALVTGVGFGLAPLWHLRGVGSGGLLQATGREDRLAPRSRVRAVLVMGQVALTTWLLVGSALLIQSLVQLQNVPLGITADSVLTAKLALFSARYPNGTAISGLLSRLTDALERAPGVRAAGVSSAIPLSPGAQTITAVATETEGSLGCEWRLVDSGYFRALQIPLLRGRLFGPEDGPDSPHVFVISQQTARALYGRGDPIGRRLRLDLGRTGEVVGVVGDVRMRNLGATPERVVYFPPSQFGFFPLFNVVVRIDGPPEAATAILRDRLKAIDPNLPPYEIQSMQHWVDHNSARMRIRTFLITSLGAIALLLGVVGVYGVTSYMVTLRAHEFGVRAALGARPRALLRLVIEQGLRFALVGIVLGLAAAALVADLVRSLLFEVDARDPVIFAGVALVVGLVALSASYVPARRAASADPLIVLRAD